MNKVYIIVHSRLHDLERKINAFAEKHEIVNISMTARTIGYSVEYTATILYKEG